MEWGDRAAGAGQRELNGNWDGKTVWRIRFQVGEGRSKKKNKVQQNPVAGYCLGPTALVVTSTNPYPGRVPPSGAGD